MEKTVRELFYERERMTLSERAFLCENTRGRETPVEPCDYRTEFQRDRDRIIHSKSFRRLMHKTQVFLIPADEHYRTRLTHTLEVTQVARIIARALLLNEDLCEAAALGHDLGHTPFGHTGETVMQMCYSPDFTHYKQSLRVVEKLENNGRGLNLTYEVRDAIVNHTGKHLASTLEGIIVKYADRIAYINHDIDDAVRAGVLRIEDIPKSILDVVGTTHSERLSRMVMSVIEGSRRSDTIEMTKDVGEATDRLRDFLFERVYYNPKAKKEEIKAVELLKGLFGYFVKYPSKMPPFYYNNTHSESVERCVCDYVSGMTDRYAISLYKELFIPNVWHSPID
ncbi:MAG: deoxyguanosinetriphosphate triphosphohydrolase [Ruminococcaceae bacterium]|nr:deoxyguanosinetriphosphate triphosphohydrolase [Oscillospiraceae bacterium]